MSNYESHNLENGELPFIYKRRRVPPTEAILESSNWHENVELLEIVKGEGMIYNNGRVLPVREGDVVVINANHLHGLSTKGEEMLHRYLIVDRAFCLDNGIDTNAVSFHERVDDDRVRALLGELNEAYSTPPETPYRTATIRSTVLRLMLLLCREHSTAAAALERPEKSLSYVKQAIAYVNASYDKNFSLEDVAAFVGVNKCYLSREFHKYTGGSFVSYVNRTRCKMAQRLLCDTQLDVHEVASRCGFENRSYFTKTFFRYVGVLPREYRDKANKGER